MGRLASQAKVIRSVARMVHMAAESREKVRTLIRNELVYAKEGIAVGEFLSVMLKGEDVTYITHYRELLELTSERIVK